jgi:hypothetical protein
MERGAKTLDVKRVLAAAKLVRRLRSVMVSGNWEWVGGVLADARAMRDTLPQCSLKELQVLTGDCSSCFRCVLVQCVRHAGFFFAVCSVS